MDTTKAGVARWLLIWTAIGCVFAVQLYWYYELPLSLSIFWGLVDWYLWGGLALGIALLIRRLIASGCPRLLRFVLYVVAAPVVMALHVVLTMAIGGGESWPSGWRWTEYFQALYAKRMTINALAFAAIVAFQEYRGVRVTSLRPKTFAARRGDRTRLVTPQQIVHGAVCGNYVNLHTQDGVWPVRSTLTELLDDLSADQFVRISRSAMVNLGRVRELVADGRRFELVLETGVRVPVARRFHSGVRRAIRAYHTGPAERSA